MRVKERGKREMLTESELRLLLIELTRDSSLFSGLLAGFSVTAVLQLVALKDTRKVVAATTLAFMLASILLLSSTAMFSFLLVDYSRGSIVEIRPLSLDLFQPSNTLMQVGLWCLLLGVGGAGFIRSERFGAFSALFAAVAVIMLSLYLLAS